MTEKDKAQFVAVFMAFLSYSQNVFIKWRQGLLKPSLWMGWEQLLINMAGARGGKAFLDGARLSIQRRVSPAHGKRFDETHTASRRETDGRV